jgi:hypothetical protein
MATKILTQARLKELLHYNPDTGRFTWLQPCNRFSQVRSGDPAGTLHKRGYIHIKVEGQSYKAHRLAWLYVHGRWPEPAIDHINRIKNDNRIVNLREADQLRNMQNKSRYKRNVSGYIGVTPHRATGKWVAQVQVNKRNHYLGVYETAETAALAYEQAKRQLSI